MLLQGLWGPGSAFADFEAFLASMKKRGVSFLEMLSMEMKVPAVGFCTTEDVTLDPVCTDAHTLVCMCSTACRWQQASYMSRQLIVIAITELWQHPLTEIKCCW